MIPGTPQFRKIPKKKTQAQLRLQKHRIFSSPFFSTFYLYLLRMLKCRNNRISWNILENFRIWEFLFDFGCRLVFGLCTMLNFIFRISIRFYFVSWADSTFKTYLKRRNCFKDMLMFYIIYTYIKVNIWSFEPIWAFFFIFFEYLKEEKNLYL